MNTKIRLRGFSHAENVDDIPVGEVDGYFFKAMAEWAVDENRGKGRSIDYADEDTPIGAEWILEAGTTIIMANSPVSLIENAEIVIRQEDTGLLELLIERYSSNQPIDDIVVEYNFVNETTSVIVDWKIVEHTVKKANMALYKGLADYGIF